MGRVLGLDPGSVRVGVALSDSSLTMAFPRPALANDATLLARLGALVADEAVEVVVVGRPVALSGRRTASTASADDLFRALRDGLAGVSVVQADERLTTVEAGRRLTSAGRTARDARDALDSAAAVVLLEAYLEASRA
jgi:putative pre-16S rRNA nuclease